MASARFLEILRCNGVDQNAAPHVGMVVPFLGENQVVLETSGMDLDVQRSPLNLQEFDGLELTTQLLRGVQDALSQPDVDPQQRDTFLPDTGWQKPRFFRVLGTIKTGFPGTFVNAVPRSRRGGGCPPRCKWRLSTGWSSRWRFATCGRATRRATCGITPTGPAIRRRRSPR